MLAIAGALATAAPASGAEANVHGLLDLVGVTHGETAELNAMWAGVSPFDAYQARVFVDGAVSDRIQVYTQFLFTEEGAGRPLGAYMMAAPWENRDIHAIAGLIPWMVGTYEPQSYSDKNPLIGAPLMYQYHSTLRWDLMPATADNLLAEAGEGYDGVNYGAGGGAYPGMPIVYSDWWDFGAGVVGSVRPMEFSLGFVNGTPSFPTPALDNNRGKGVLGRVGVAPTAGARFGVSGAYGPYMSDKLSASLPPGKRVGDYHQVLVMGDAEWSMGHAELRAEGYRNTWETPTVGDLRVKGFYVEGKYALPAGFYVAGRYDVMRFSEIADSTGESRPWDADETRSELGVGYRLARGALAKVVYQRNLEKEEEDEGAEVYDLVAAQLSIRF
jgi:hypothetical protein